MSGYNYSLFGSPIYKLHVSTRCLSPALPLMLPLSSDHGRQSLFDLKRPLRGAVKAAGRGQSSRPFLRPPSQVPSAPKSVFLAQCPISGIKEGQGNKRADCKVISVKRQTYAATGLHLRIQMYLVRRSGPRGEVRRSEQMCSRIAPSPLRPLPPADFR